MKTAKEWLRFAVVVPILLFLIPYFRPDRLLRSGLNADAKWWERAIFKLAGLAMLIGVPLLLFGFFAGENISHWHENRPATLSRTDVDWDRFWPPALETGGETAGSESDATETEGSESDATKTAGSESDATETALAYLTNLRKQEAPNEPDNDFVERFKYYLKSTGDESDEEFESRARGLAKGVQDDISKTDQAQEGPLDIVDLQMLPPDRMDVITVAAQGSEKNKESQALISQLQAADEMTRAAAVERLAAVLHEDSHEEQVLNSIVEALAQAFRQRQDGPSKLARLALTQMLKSYGKTSAPVREAVLHVSLDTEEDTEIRIAATDLLGAIGLRFKKVRDALQSLQKDSDHDVAANATDLLNMLKRKSGGTKVR